MTDEEVSTLEQATLAAVPPARVQRLDAWLLGLDRGTVGRAHSAVPLRHREPDPGVLARIEACYEANGLRAVFRIAHAPGLASVREQLAGRGYDALQPTSTMTGTVAGVAAMAANGAAVRFEDQPGEDWSAVFLGEGFDPVDGASRLGLLRRARQSVFAAVHVDGEAVAVGSACFAHGWCGIHGMRTRPGWRSRGFASAILAALAREAATRGIRRAFLQVEQGNTAARSLYRRAGFADAWVYEYWRR